MTRKLQWMLQLPLATLAGVALGVLGALIAAVLSVLPVRQASHPLLPFALALAPALLGVWIDWARLWRPSRRTRFWSAALLVLTAVATADAALLASSVTGSLLLAPLLPLGFAAIVQLGACLVLAVARRGRSVLGFTQVAGTVRRDETDRVVLDTPDGVVELDRRVPDLGPDRAVDLSIAAPLTVLARLSERGAGDPFRAERRHAAVAVLGVAPSSTGLAAIVRRRARAWTLYLLLLAALSAALAPAAAYSPAEAGCSTRRGCDLSR